MIYRVCVTKYGYLNIKANSADEALNIVNNSNEDSDFDWSDFGDAEIMDEFEE